MTVTPKLRQTSPQSERRHSNTPSMTSASSVYDDDSLGSPPQHWQQYHIMKDQDEMGRKKAEGPYAPASIMANLPSPQENAQQLRTQDSLSRLNGNAADSTLIQQPAPVYSRASPSPSIDRSAALSMPPPPLPNKDLRRPHLLKSATDLKAAALGSLRNKTSRKNLSPIGLPSSPKPIGLPSSPRPLGLPSSPKPNDARLISPLPTSVTAIRLATPGTPPAVLTKSHTELRGPGFTSPTSPLGSSSPISPANSSDKMLSRIGRNILRSSVQKKSDSVSSETATIDIPQETASNNKPALTLDIAAAVYEPEQEPTWQLEHSELESDLPAPPRIPTHERNTSSIYSAGSQTLVPDQTLSINSTTPEPRSQALTPEPASQALILAPQPAYIPADRKIPYDAFGTPPPPLTKSHFMCYQNHASMKSTTNRHAPVPCMVCWTVDSDERVRCTFCAMRICKTCADRLKKDPERSLGRLVEAVEKEG